MVPPRQESGVYKSSPCCFRNPGVYPLGSIHIYAISEEVVVYQMVDYLVPPFDFVDNYLLASHWSSLQQGEHSILYHSLLMVVIYKFRALAHRQKREEVAPHHLHLSLECFGEVTAFDHSP